MAWRFLVKRGFGKAGQGVASLCDGRREREVIVELTREKALELHRQMWGDMKKKYGDNPTSDQRYYFKREWCMKHFPGEEIESCCFLCEFTTADDVCDNCPIDWGYNERTNSSNCCNGLVKWEYDSISEILALPERNDVS